MMTMFVLVPNAGGFGPAVPTGWINRALVLSNFIWVFLVARSVLIVAQQTKQVSE